jgi:hypothetical protein
MKNYLFKSKIIFIILDLILLLYCLLELYFKTNTLFKKKKIKNAALVFDKNQFFNSTRKSGNVICAKVFYKILSKKNIKIDIVDLNEKILTNNQYDLILGIASKSYIKLCQTNKNALKVLFLVNSNFLKRNLILIKKYFFYSLPLDLYEVINPLIYTRSLKFSHKVFLLGSKTILRTYDNLPKKIINKFELINLMPSKIFLKKKTHKKKNYVNIGYFFGYAGVRKGLLEFLIRYQKLIVNNKFFKEKKINLIIFGNISDEVQNLINKKISFSFKTINQLSSLDYSKAISDIDIAILFSHDEGQNFSILEAIFSGSLPFVDLNSGLEFKKPFIIKNVENERLFEQNFIKIINLLNTQKYIFYRKEVIKSVINNNLKSENAIKKYFTKYI